MGISLKKYWLTLIRIFGTEFIRNFIHVFLEVDRRKMWINKNLCVFQTMQIQDPLWKHVPLHNLSITAHKVDKAAGVLLKMSDALVRSTAAQLYAEEEEEAAAEAASSSTAVSVYDRVGYFCTFSIRYLWFGIGNVRLWLPWTRDVTADVWYLKYKH